MKIRVYLLFLPILLLACQTTQNPQIVEVTVIVTTTPELSKTVPVETNTLTYLSTTTLTPTPISNPCLLWNQVTSEFEGQITCVRGIITAIEIVEIEGKWEFNGVYFDNNQVRWDFSLDRKGFFTLSQFRGWHPETGKGIEIGDCVALTSEIELLPDGRTYIYWGTKSTFIAQTETTYYFKHPELQVFEDKTFC